MNWGRCLRALLLNLFNYSPTLCLCVSVSLWFKFYFPGPTRFGGWVDICLRFGHYPRAELLGAVASTKEVQSPFAGSAIRVARFHDLECPGFQARPPGYGLWSADTSDLWRTHERQDSCQAQGF